jgi:predicted alpha/beta hydrolase family esterase
MQPTPEAQQREKASFFRSLTTIRIKAWTVNEHVYGSHQVASIDGQADIFHEHEQFQSGYLSKYRHPHHFTIVASEQDPLMKWVLN